MTATKSIICPCPVEGSHLLVCAEATLTNKLDYQNIFSIRQLSQFPCFFIGSGSPGEGIWDNI